MFYTTLKKYFLLFLVFLNINLAKAQLGKEAWHWQFGNGVSLDFSSGTPVRGTSSIHAEEGSASYSDPNTGQLLFYTDGDTIWDRNNNVMPNGTGLIGGDGTTTQAALIIPKPGSHTLFYVITADQGGYAGPNKGVFYSMVDISLHSGLGNVTVKNTLLTPPPTTEKLVAVPNCNGIDYWIITHPFNSDAFNVYSLTSSGINPISIVSNVGTIEQQDSLGIYGETIGYLKASPNSKKLALGVDYATPHPWLEIFDFDNSTGKVSNPITITNYYGQGQSGPYGLSFSPDNSKLYTFYSYTGAITQYDLSSNNPTTIKNSGINIGHPNGTNGSIQMGPDGKLYVVANFFGKFVSVINNPNNLGLSCNFQDTVIHLPNGSATIGLPNFIQYNTTSFDSLAMPDIVKCNTFTTDTLNAGAGFSNYFWSTGATTQSITVNNSGTYWVTVVTQSGCIATDTVRVEILTASNLSTLKDTTVCNSSGYYLADATYSGALSYNWSNGISTAENFIYSSGTYWVDINFGAGCTIRDSLNLHLYSNPIITLPQDTAVCNSNTNAPLIITAFSGAGNMYNWSTGASTQAISVNSTNIYSVTVTSQAGCKTSKEIQVYYYGKSFPIRDTTTCSNGIFQMQLNGTPRVPTPNSSIYNTYQWNNGYNTATTNIYSTGIYFVDAQIVMPNGTQCKVRDTFLVNSFTFPINNIFLDTTVECKDLPVKINSSYPNVLQYEWNDGYTSPIHALSKPGTYVVFYKFNNGCSADAYFKLNVVSKVQEIIFPNIITPNEDGINDFIDFGSYNFSSFQFKVFNRWGDLIFESQDPSCIWEPFCEDGTYFYTAQYKLDCGTATETIPTKGFISVIR